MSDPAGGESAALERAQQTWREVAGAGPGAAPAATGRGILRRVRYELLVWCLIPAALVPVLAVIVYFLIALLSGGSDEVRPFVYAN